MQAPAQRVALLTRSSFPTWKPSGRSPLMVLVMVALSTKRRPRSVVVPVEAGLWVGGLSVVPSGYFLMMTHAGKKPATSRLRVAASSPAYVPTAIRPGAEFQAT